MDILLKLVSPVLSIGKMIWARASLHWRVAKDVVDQAHRVGANLNLRELRWQLEKGRILRALESKDPTLQRSAVDDLFAQLKVESTIEWDASTLLDFLRSAYVEKLQTPKALRVLQASTEASIESGVRRVEDAVIGGSADQSRFDSRLERIPGIRSSVLRELRGSWPQGPMVLGRIVESTDPAALLADWAAEEPAWLAGAPPAALAWLGSIAVDHDAKEAGVHFFDRALDSGISPRGYWQVRRVWASSMESGDEIVGYLGDDPSYPLARMVVESTRRPQAELPAVLDGWNPTSEDEQVTAAIIRAQLAENLHDFDTAIELGRAWFRSHQSVSAGLVATRALLARNATDPSLLTRSDVADARDLAIQLRDNRRKYGMSSAEPVSLAALASQLLSDSDSAWRLTQMAPDGEATLSEASAQVVRNRALLIAAEQGDMNRADILLADIGDPFTASKARALLADRRGNPEDGLEAWKSAMTLTSDPSEKAQVAAALAMHGYSDPFLDELAVNNPDISAELRQNALLFAGTPEGLASAKVAARSSQTSAFNLLSYYARTDQTAAAAKLAVATATRWPDADTWRRAATLHEALGEWDRAIELARSALLEGGSAWGGAADCHFLIVRCYSRLGDWDNATNAAADLVATDRQSDWARWMLVLCQINAGDYAGALTSWRVDGRSLRPDNRQQTLAWIELFRLFGNEVAHASELVELAKRWKDDEEVRRHIVGAFVIGTYKADDSVGADILPEYLADFPDANYLIPITIDENRPLESLQEAINARFNPLSEAARQSAIAEMREQVVRCEMPLGMMSVAHNKTYAEAVILRAATYRYSGPADLAKEVEAVAAALTMTTVVDSTAMFTQILLAKTLGPTLSGTFADLVVTSEQYRDSGQAHSHMRNASGMEFKLGGPGEAPSGEALDERDLAERKSLASDLWDLFGEMRRVAHPRTVSLLGEEPREEASDHDEIDIVLSAADEALTNRHAFWSDDIVLRRLVTERGVPTFGTPAIIEYLRQSGEVDPGLLDAAEATLISSHYVGIQFRMPVFELAAGLDGANGRGTLAAIMKSGGESANKKIALALKLMLRHAGDPLFIREWAYGVAVWLATVATGDQASLVRIWAKNVFEMPWISASTLPFVVEGLKSATADSMGSSAMVFDAFHDFYRQLVEIAQYESAAAYCIALVAGLEDEDRSTIIGAIVADTE